MLGKLIVSQIFGIPSTYVSSTVYSNLFGVAAPLVIPLAAWLIVSLYVLAKL